MLLSPCRAFLRGRATVVSGRLCARGDPGIDVYSRHAIAFVEILTGAGKPPSLTRRHSVVSDIGTRSSTASFKSGGGGGLVGCNGLLFHDSPK